MAIDTGRIEAAVAEILVAIGENPSRPGLESTPSRVAQAYGEFFAGLAEDPLEPLADTVPTDGRGELVLVRDIEVPILIIHSEEDWRCPINQAEELFTALRLLGKDVTFYRFPGESHELSRSGSPVHRCQRAEIILDFFAERLTA